MSQVQRYRDAIYTFLIEKTQNRDFYLFEVKMQNWDFSLAKDKKFKHDDE